MSFVLLEILVITQLNFWIANILVADSLKSEPREIIQINKKPCTAIYEPNGIKFRFGKKINYPHKVDRKILHPQHNK